MKKSVFVSTIITVILLVLSLSSCMFSSNEKNHEHTYSSDWSFDESSHWKAGSCEHTELKAESGEHIWDEGRLKNGEECNPNAVFVQSCTVCGAEKESTAEAHVFNLIESKDSSCTLDGYEFYSCAICKKENWIDHKAMGHKISVPTESVEPSCTKDGYTKGECDNCNETVTLTISALGHTDLEMNYTNELCGNIKIGNITCKICNETVSEFGHSLNKTVVNATCTEDGFIKYECENCTYCTTQVQKSFGHIEGAWQQTKAPTCSLVGERATYCLSCGELVETMEVSKVSHTYSSEVANGEIVYSCTLCTHSYSVPAVTTHLISFESNGGSQCASLNANYGEALSLPTPSKEGYSFNGWYFDAELKNGCPSDYVVLKDTTLYADWAESSTKAASEEKTLFVDVPLSFEFNVVTDVELTDENLSDYIFVKDPSGNKIDIYISSNEGKVYSIGSGDYKENTTYEVFILKSLSFEKASSNTMWFITDGDKQNSIKFLPNVKHINESDVYAVIQSEDKVYVFLLEDKFNSGDIVVVHGKNEDEILLAMEIMSEDIINNTYSYQIQTANPEKVYEESNIFYSGELDISNIEFSETLEEELVEQLKSSELYEQIRQASIIFASENSTKDVKFTLKDIKITPKFSASGSKLFVKYTVSAIFERKIDDEKQNFSISIAISNTTSFSSNIWFHWVDNFSLVVNTRNECQIDFYATGSSSIGNETEAFKRAFYKAKDKGKWEDITNKNAESSSNSTIGTVDIPLQGVTLSIELSAELEFKVTGEIGVSARFINDMGFGVRSIGYGVELVRTFDSNADITFVVRGKMELSYMLKLRVGIKFLGIFEVYVEAGVGPYAELSGMFVASSSSLGGNRAVIGGYFEAGLKTELKVGATAKIEIGFWIWKETVVVFDLSHTWDLEKITLMSFGEENIALYFEKNDETVQASITCGKNTNISNSVDKNMVFQKVDKLTKSTSYVNCNYYLAENYEGISISPDGVISCNLSSFTHGEYKDIKVKVTYGTIYKIVNVRLKLHHDLRNVRESAPTCTQEGTTAYIYCANCDLLISGEKIITPALGHSFSDEWSSNITHHWNGTTCGHDVKENLEVHIWDEGTITRKTTCYYKGNIQYSCLICEHKRNEDIDLIEHTYEGTNSFCSVCGAGAPYTFEELSNGTYKIMKYNGTEGDIVIPSLLNGCAITEIDTYAFYRNQYITSVIIPDSITKIDTFSFTGCNKLKRVVIGDGVTTIEDSTFFDCDPLVEVVIGENVTKIGEYAFFDCELLTKVTFTGQNLTEIGPKAFMECDALTSISLPEGLAFIDEYAFISTGLTSITFPDSLETIGYMAFHGCKDLQTITFGSGLKCIEDFAFDSLTYVKSIDIPDSVVYIGEKAFWGTEAIESISIGAGTKVIKPSAFGFCNSLSKITVSEDNTAYKAIDNVLYTIDGKTIVQYPIGNTNESFVIPSDVETIGAFSFYGCHNLTTISIPSTVKIIEKMAFCGGEKLTSVEISEGVTSIGDSAFYLCTNLANVSLPSSIEHFGANVFKSSSNLVFNEYDNACYLGNSSNKYLVLVKSKSSDITSCKIHNDTVFIANLAFDNCTKLTSIIIPEGVKSIGDSAFNGCTSLTQLTLANSVTEISSVGVSISAYTEYGNAYYLGSADNPYMVLVKAKNTDITNCVVHEDTKIIYNNAFLECFYLSNINLPDGLISIGDKAFEKCEALTSITIPNSVTSIGQEAFSNCSSLESVVLSNQITEIKYETFYFCDNLASIIIPSSVKIIGRDAFRLTDLTSIILPANIEKIGEGAFVYCYLFDNVVFEGDCSWVVGGNIYSAEDLSDSIKAAEILSSSTYDWIKE